MPNVAPLHANDLRRVGRYRLTGRIEGSPAEGPAYLAAMADGTQVTLTLLDVGWVQTGAAKDRFTAEARAARRVPPFCTARIVDAGVDEGQAYLVREYVNGPSLADLVTDEAPLKDGSLVALAVGMATGLAAIHQAGLVHGQFGPEHVILGTNGPKVAGFGITPPYGAATPSADMLGWAHAVLFAATGLTAGASAGLAVLPEPLRGLVARCAALDPAARPTARAVVIELTGIDDPSADLLAEGSRRAVRAAFRPPAELPEREPQAAPSRSGAIWWAVGIMVCVVAIAIAVHVLQNQSSRPAAATNPAATHTQAALPTGTAGGKNSTLTAPSASPLPSPAAGAIPVALAGTWSGQVKQGSDVFNVQLEMVRGATSGTIRYSGKSFTCTGVLTVVSSAGDAVTVHQVIRTGQCEDGTVTLRSAAPAALRFKYAGTAGPVALGTLARK
jgi:eukaryotic-like serine/threonine-protein kinase